MEVDETFAGDPIERVVGQLTGELPALSGKVFSEALSEMAERPRASLRYVLKLFTSGKPEARAIAARILLRSEPTKFVDDMNAIIFDADQDAETKVRANDLLAQVGNAVDEDVFAMSVPDADPLRKKLPSQTRKLLSEEAIDAALAHARALHPADRWLVIHDSVESAGEQTLAFIRGLAGDNEENAIAVISAISETKFDAGVELLLELQKTSERGLQKLVKRTLFEMGKTNVAASVDKPAAAVGVSESSDNKPVVIRSLMSEPAARGSVLVVIGWKRPNGRLQVFSVIVDLWKRGVSDAILRRDMSRSAFERFVNANTGNRPPLQEASFEDCRAMIARGIRLAREFGSRLPLDLGLGKKLLPGLDALVEEIENPFFCSECNQPLEEAIIKKIKADAPYDNIPPETRCTACRE